MPIKNLIFLLVAAIAWGFAFSFQSEGGSMLPPLYFNSLRTLMGAVSLIPVMYVMARCRKSSPDTASASSFRNPKLWLAGLIMGIILCVASNLQQEGLRFTSPGKSGFLTACYILLVPLAGLVLKRPCSKLVFCAVGIAVFALYFLCIPVEENLTISLGDTLTLLSAVGFCTHIMTIDYYSARFDGVKLAFTQFLVAGTIGFLVYPFYGEPVPTLQQTIHAWIPLLYAGIMSSGVAYTFQIIGQKGVNPTVASIIMSLESCFAVLGGWLLLGKQLSQREYLGCALMFAAILLAQIPPRKKKTA